MDTRQALIDTAITLFGQRGMDGVGTREIAARAGKQMSAIGYHFGTKEKLYLACADYIGNSIGEQLGEDAALDAAACGTPNEARETIQRFMTAMADMMATDEAEAFTMFIMREHQQPSAALDTIGECMFDPMHERLSDCVALCRPDIAADEVKALTMLLIGMPVGLRAQNAGIVRQFGCDRIDEPLLALFKKMIADNVDRLLASPSS